MESNDRVLVFVKLKGGVEPPHRSDQWLQELLGAEWDNSFLGSIVVEVFAKIDGVEIRSFVERAARRDAQYEVSPQEFGRFFAIECRQVTAGKLAEALAEAQKTEYAEVGTTTISSLPWSKPNWWSPPTDGEVEQGYLEEIRAPYAWTLPAGRGSSVRLVDIESSWNLEHADLIEAGITLIDGQTGTFQDAINHGTAVLGIVTAMDDGRGVIGIAHEIASARVVSMVDQRSFVNLPRAILIALRELRFGDILLIEVDTNLGKGRLPVEVQRCVFDLIRLATARGVIVIEPAGNGYRDLDGFKRNDNGSMIQPFNRSNRSGFRDSGALVVGGSRSGFNHPRHRMSNYGSRIDCYAWAENVMTTWHVHLLRRLSKWGGWLMTRRLLRFFDIEPGDDTLITETAGFSGTSSAAAIIAGVAACVQSLTQAYLGFRHSPWQLRLLLSDGVNGTSSNDPASDKIGVMPNLEKIIDNVLRISDRTKNILDALPQPSAASSPDVQLIKEGAEEEGKLLLLSFHLRLQREPWYLRLEILSRLPRSVRGWLEMPRHLSDLKGIWRIPTIAVLEEGNAFVPLNPNGQTYFREADFPAESGWRLVLEGVPDGGATYEIAVRVMDGWTEVARLTWNVPPSPA